MESGRGFGPSLLYMSHQEIQIKDKIVKVWEGDFVKLQEISTNAATPSSVTFENIKKNITLGLPKIEKLPEYQKIKGHENKIALVGGGPSLKKVIHELRDFRTIIVAGSSHDYVISQNIIPTYAAICDPDPISVNYYRNKHPEVKYLLSTGLDEKLIAHFEGYQRVLWHCHSEDYDRVEIEKLEGCVYHGISGGCTVGLRAINIAIMLGYTNLHFFGYDSCMSEEECHAYTISTKEREDMGRLYSIKLRDFNKEGPADKKYICLGYQLAQAYAFKEFFLNFGKIFSPTFHGEGLLKDLYELIVHTLNNPPLKEEPLAPVPYHKLDGLVANAAITAEEQLKSVRINIKNNHPRFNTIQGYGRPKGDEPIALVGGGPSLKDTIDELSDFRTILSCGSVHDYLINRGIAPTYAANCDPDELCVNYFKEFSLNTTYLISSNSHPKLFEKLKQNIVAMWHCETPDQRAEMERLDKEQGIDFHGVPGGATIGMRSIYLAMFLGYTNIHFFGFDSSMRGDNGQEHHAYPFATKAEEGVEVTYKIKLGNKDGIYEGKEYNVAGYQIVQMENFKDIYCANRMFFKPTFHGDGALPEYFARISKEIDDKLAKGAI